MMGRTREIAGVLFAVALVLICGCDTDPMESVRKSAEQGDADAQLELGRCYENGKGVEQSFEEAVKWYRKAAEQGNMVAYAQLGQCYENGKGVEQSRTEAMRWYRKGVDQREKQMAKDAEQLREAAAVKWFRKSAEQGNVVAQFKIGFCYETGRGVEQSWAEAVKWYRMAASRGSENAAYHLGMCYYYGWSGATKSLTEAARWYRLAEQNGYKLSDGERKFAHEN